MRIAAISQPGHRTVVAAPVARSRWAAVALAASAALAALTSCATGAPGAASSTAQLTYETQPAGAHLYEGQVRLGQAPVTRSYQAQGQATSIRTPEVTAVWPSGAKASFWTELLPGADNVAKIERPDKAPGLQADLDHAKRVTDAASRMAARDKEQTLREQARQSARCKEQASKGVNSSNVIDCTGP